ncbi:MAG: hypothetical protein EOO03_05890 [Chitinophagaceae bacterium]|nr:MAG: hypothetical protein EOO03_05890 [Chitinophagaceae bacterium]
MSKTDLLGKIAFINHEKKYAMIEYDQNGKKKTVKGSIDDKVQKELKEKKMIKKTHHFLMGDVVSFKLKLSDRGDKMIATNINFLYNNALDVLINQAMTNNKFTGYLKSADDQYFVKEINSYLFFPISFAPWQIIPAADDLNEPVTFTLENLEKKDKIFASLLNNEYVPEFHTIVKHFKSKTPIEATITEINPHGIYLDLAGDKLKAKIPLGKNEEMDALAKGLQKGGLLKVTITHIGKNRINVEPVKE